MLHVDDTCQHYIRQRVKLDHFSYLKGKVVPSVSLGCPVVQSGYLKGKIGQLPYFNTIILGQTMKLGVLCVCVDRHILQLQVTF